MITNRYFGVPRKRYGYLQGSHISDMRKRYVCKRYEPVPDAQVRYIMKIVDEIDSYGARPSAWLIALGKLPLR